MTARASAGRRAKSRGGVRVERRAVPEVLRNEVEADPEDRYRVAVLVAHVLLVVMDVDVPEHDVLAGDALLVRVARQVRRAQLLAGALAARHPDRISRPALAELRQPLA